VRGTLIGSVLGVLPGGGATLSAFAGYVLEKKVAKDPSRFGKGAIKASPGRSRPTTPGRRRHSSRCSRSAFPATR